MLRAQLRALSALHQSVFYVCAGKPTDSGISLQAVKELGPDFPLFGVCMGHQCIGEAFGGALVAGLHVSRVSLAQEICRSCFYLFFSEGLGRSVCLAALCGPCSSVSPSSHSLLPYLRQAESSGDRQADSYFSHPHLRYSHTQGCQVCRGSSWLVVPKKQGRQRLMPYSSS